LGSTGQEMRAGTHVTTPTPKTFGRRHARVRSPHTAWWKAQAKGLLLFCAHHARAHELDLTADGWELSIDDRASLEPVCEPEPA